MSTDYRRLTMPPASSPPSPTDIRRSIEAGLCPFCQAGPFAVVASHTNRAHGVDRKALRDMAGLFYSASICAPEVSQRCREQGKKTKYAALRRAGLAGPGKRRLSEAAKALNEEKLKRGQAARRGDTERAAQVVARGREIRARARLSRSVFGKLVDFSPGTVLRWETGECSPVPDAVERYARALDRLEAQMAQLDAVAAS